MDSLSNKGKKEDRPSTGIGQRARNLQRGWADWMGRRTTHLKRGHWLVALALFILLAGGYNGYLMFGSFDWKGKTIFSIFPIHKPAFFKETGETGPETRTELPSGEYERIHRFRMYMDSLAQSPSGKPVYDSILQHRPGLMDSVLFIEKHYQP